MSIDTRFYVGFYIIPPMPEVTQETTTRSCSLPCGRRASPGFKVCPYCANPITERTTSTLVRRFVAPDDVEGNWQDFVFRHNTDYGKDVWLPNQARMGDAFSTPCDGTNTTWDSSRMEDELKRFMAAHRELLDAVQQQFGQPATVHFGAVLYYT